MHTMQNCFSVLKLWLSEVRRSKVNSSEKCESCLCLPKDCCFRHSAVWVSPLQLVFLKFSHLSLSFRCNSKRSQQNKLIKKAAKTASVLESLVRTVLGCCIWGWEAQTDCTGWWTGTASWLLSSLSFCSSPHCSWPGAQPLVKASQWPSGIWWRCSHPAPLFCGAGAGPCWPEDFRISECFQY